MASWANECPASPASLLSSLCRLSCGPLHIAWGSCALLVHALEVFSGKTWKIWRSCEDGSPTSWILNLQRFLFRACLEAAAGMGILDMKWEGCSSVSDTFHGAEVAAFWPPELRSSIRTKFLGCHGICLVAQLRPGLSQVLVVQFSCAGRKSLPPTWKLGDANLCQLGHGGFCVPGSESLVDQAAMWGAHYDQVEAGIPAGISISPFFSRIFGNR